MPISRRLAVILNGIVVSSLGACGGVSEGNRAARVGEGGGVEAGGGSDGDEPAGGGTAGRGSAGGGASGRIQAAGSGSGGRAFAGAGEAGAGEAGAGEAGAGEAGAAGSGSGGVSAGGNGTGGGAGKQSMPVCDEQGGVSYLQGLQLPEAVDYLGVYFSERGAPVGQFRLFRSTGTACSGAVDLAACQAALAQGAPSAGFSPLYMSNPPSPLPLFNYMFLAYTRGGSVGFISKREQLNAFLGEIDTANEAALTFLSMGVTPKCARITETADAYTYVLETSLGACTIGPTLQSVTVTRDGRVSETTLSTPTACVGRRPSGLFEVEAERSSPLGDYYASVAHLEAAAVLAFEVMEHELLRFGAPHELRLRARRARLDEQRHARQIGDLARREGATVASAAAPSPSERSLLAAALENAVEGCVREAWGALSAHYQAATACDPEAQRLWREIAHDESEHAELSFALHDWFMQQMAAEERAQVEAAMQRARCELRAELAHGPAPHPAVTRQAGVPDPARAVALFSQLEKQLLSA